MKIANLKNRLVLVKDGRALDVESATFGAFAADPQDIYENWDAFTEWGKSADFTAAVDYTDDQLDAVVPRPRQIFAIGLNYREHAAEAGFELPTHPMVFTKFQSSIAAPQADIELPSNSVDYEVELVVVIGKQARRVSVEDAWDYVAGLTAGQDISERAVQSRGPAPQFNLAKSFPNFSPIGPVVVTPDEFADRDSIRVRTLLSDGGSTGDSTETKQDGNTSDLIFSVAELIARLSQTLTLFAGDLIFTGTPAGVAIGKQPPVFLRKGQTLVTVIDGVGELRNRLV
ncbi:MAG: fumarylacetoacetate hydrolase family protein [Microbacteriaceae bacterium]|nr:fumarylacetoacetate hydrolase family protein [Microbacteriaceae bacterium]